MIKINEEEALYLGEFFKINFDVVPFDEWMYGLNVELEHGSKLGLVTNLTNNDSTKTAKIAIAHLIEDPRYYKYLKIMEYTREQYWSKKNSKPSIFLSSISKDF